MIIYNMGIYKNSTISVIIPLYNKENSIEKTIYSVLEQTYENFEVIVVNDGSTDNSLDIIKSIKSDKIRIITQKNSGVSAARNRGIDEAKGDWIVFLDADDYMLPNALSHLLLLVKDSNVLIGCANFCILDKEYKIYKCFHSRYNGITDNVNKQMFFGKTFLRMGNTIISKNKLYNVRFNTLLRRYEDLDLFLRVTHNERVAVSSVPVMIYSYLNGNLATNFSDSNEDYLSHIEFDKTNFWEKMFLAQTINRERKNYLSVDLYSFYPSLMGLLIVIRIVDVFLRVQKKIYKRLFNY